MQLPCLFQHSTVSPVLELAAGVPHLSPLVDPIPCTGIQVKHVHTGGLRPNVASDILRAVSRQDSLFAPEQKQQSYQEQKRRAQTPKRIEKIEKELVSLEQAHIRKRPLTTHFT